VVRVETERGPVVLGSDAAHFYANIERGIPFPVMDNVAATVLGMERIRRLAASDDRVIPGHDPLVLARYPAALTNTDGIVRLDVSPFV
jgi:glyoxylase-like metal-dependent hydrolase (beta-lactamase superfamily II)